jgi:hypothetical protein
VPIRWKTILPALGIAALSASAASALGPPTLAWSNLDGSAPPPSSGGVFLLRSTAGQQDAFVGTGGAYRLTGGYWAMPAITSTDAPSPLLPAAFAIRAARPNPFRRGTSLELALPEPSRVRVELFGIAGERVVTLVDGVQSAGTYPIAWDGRDAAGHVAPAGIYFARVLAGDHHAVLRLIKID